MLHRDWSIKECGFRCKKCKEVKSINCFSNVSNVCKTCRFNGEQTND